MKKYFCIITLLVLFILPTSIKAEEYDCYYYSKNKRSEVGYNLQEKHVGLVGNNSIDIIKFKGKALNKSTTGNKSVGDQIPDKCYEYVSIKASKVMTSGRTTYSFKLGDDITDVSSQSNADDVILKLNGFPEDSEEKICQNEVKSSINYNNDLDELDLDIKETYAVRFKFVTKEDGKREFIVSYDGAEKSSGEFESTNVPSVSLDNVKNDNGDIATFGVDSEYVEKFWGACVAPSMFNIKKSGSTYTLFSDRKEDNENYQKEENTPQEDLDITEVEVCGAGTTSLLVFQVIGYIILIIKILVPIILIVLGSIDLGKASLSGDDKAVKEAAISFAKRVLIGLIIFFVPTILDFFLGLVEGTTDVSSKYRGCTDCVLNPNNSSKCSPKKLNDNNSAQDGVSSSGKF